MKSSRQSNKGLSLVDKILIFFFGVLFITIVGFQYLYNLPGSDKQKRQGIILYYAGILFWVLVIAIAFYFFGRLDILYKDLVVTNCNELGTVHTNHITDSF